MMNRSLPSFLTLAFVLLIGSLLDRQSSAAPININGGYQVDSSSSVGLHSLYGTPAVYNATPMALGLYDFGTGSGPVNVGNASSVFSRLASVSLAAIGSSATVQVLQLAFTNVTDQAVSYSSFSPTATGSGRVVASVSQGFVPLGTETITRTSDTGGTFTLSYRDEIDFRTMDGTLLSTTPVLTITSINGTWQTTPPPGSLLIPGVNDNNFFITNITLMNSLGNSRSEAAAAATAVPEPSSLALCGVGLAGLGIARARRWVGRA